MTCRSAKEGQAMWRAFFLSFGIFLCVMGLECLLMEKAVLAGGRTQATYTTASYGGASYGTSPLAQGREVTPPEWAPWSLLSVGAITIIYSRTLKRNG